MGFIKLDSHWLAARFGDVGLSGVDLTTTHAPDSSTQPWMQAVVPGTILATLLENKLIPDPFFGLENKNIIDIADSGREYYTFWFSTKFNIPTDKRTRAWLQFRGINYQGEVFLNGHQKLLSKGMFLRHVLDVTDWINPSGPNYLAVLVHPPDHPGRIPPAGGQGGDHQIAKDVATQYVEGWDWMAPIRDRNTGIWDEISLLTTGPLKISDPHLVSSFFDNYKRVYLHVSTEITNPTSASISCVIKLEVGIESSGSVYTIEHSSSQELVIPGFKTALFTFPPVFLYKPELWWPNGMGKQALHKVDIILDIPGYGESDLWSHPFGLRKVESHIDSSTGGRLFKVNGEPLFVRGGNWIVSDGLLRLSDKRYKSDIDFHADMNFNMIRCWGGGIAERPEFYHHCDRRGLLVWQEFWITGDNNGRGADPPSDPNWPLDHQLFLACAKDTIRLLRNYASLALWVGGNEQHPPHDINDALKIGLELHPWFQSPALPTDEALHDTSTDPSRYLDGTRLYIEGSLWDGFARGNGDFTDGPYTIQNPEDFFKDNFYSYGFNPEVGSVGMPVAATIKATMPREAWQIPRFEKQKNGYVAEVPNPTWDYHTYIPYSNPGFVHDQIELYGEAKDLDDFCEKAQLVNYVQYRALMEGWTSRMWTKYTGVLIWKNQNPWTGLRGQFYDHLHDQTGGFFGVRCACEPIHVQLNLATNYIEVVNTTARSLAGLSVEATVWCLDGSNPYHQVAQLAAPSKKTTSTFEMKYSKSKNAQSVYFLLLKLTNAADETLLSRNFYWLYLPGGNYRALQSFRSNKAPIRMQAKSQMTGRSCKLLVDIENLSGGVAGIGKDGPVYDPKISEEARDSSCLMSRLCPCWTSRFSRLFPAEEAPPRGTTAIQPVVAFWLHLSVLDGGEEGSRILPVAYSQNYFSLMPGEKMNVEVSFEVPDGTTPTLVLSGWNIDKAVLPINYIAAKLT